MSCDEPCEHDWHYESPRTLAGALQRGLGRGAERAMADPAAPDLVTACLRRDYRWDRQVDERDVYLARLVRDLKLPIAPISAQLHAEADDGDHGFAVALGVLEVLARAGLDGVVEEVRGYIRDGDRWLDALESVARTWPVAWWDDLHSTVIDRWDTISAEYPARWLSPPWTHWADWDERIAAEVLAARRRPKPPRPLAGEPAAALLGILREPDRVDEWRPVLRELRHRPPEPALLDLIDGIVAVGVPWSLHGVIENLGARALPAARRWAAAPGHSLTWNALEVLAAHGDAADVPALLAGLDWLDGRTEDLCGYQDLAAGLARIGGPSASAALPQLRQLWFSPHSYERAAYLRAQLAIEPAGAPRRLAEGLWDCEADVRLLAVRHAPLDNRTRERLRYLRDDPIETADVRTAASSRLM